ncbi:hypothetical protein [Aquimarina sediminis]|uniref:hypothetical protein n=1 Tax=Aquimarina sediminis TaxID=2070536 RepID=UPI000CA036FC|nr:hypothetical protein [Aquimarina sediminis]
MTWKGKYSGVFLFYGHSHGKLNSHSRKLVLDVGVDFHDLPFIIQRNTRKTKYKSFDMKDDEKFIEYFERAKTKYKLVVHKYPIEMHNITYIIENINDFKSSEIQGAFKKLHLILDDIDNDINSKL